ncbi:hypothetical protein E5082_01755 [Streptomyces griseoluteus]|uniref:Uncharacterized protein n=1 Tax=Streptomyces griseoluteus TaxID=29306 RepID=A0A4Z1DRU7_STRGP|nr:hypothetical protein [Streptomyces griseoluteus]TGN87172.1 hypothetical protein E5082_01755 [Streptomyces griseoluteus]GHF15016.1 hypothetical protein GCM10017776_36290 [Streptomyces griseoluteus]
MKKLLSLATGIGVALSIGMLPNASAATAAETGVQKADCDVWKSSKAPWTGYARCTGMLPLVERVQVKVICMGPDGKQWTLYGPGKGNGETSSKKCADDPNIGVYKVGAYVYRI